MWTESEGIERPQDQFGRSISREAARQDLQEAESSAEFGNLTANEVARLFGRKSSLDAVHWLLASNELQQAALAALLGKAGSHSVSVHGSNLPIPNYLRLVSGLCREAAAQTEQEAADEAPNAYTSEMKSNALAFRYTPDADEVAPKARCPADTQYTIVGFDRYSDDTWKLGDVQHQKFLRIVDEIAASVVPPAKPISRIVVIGHADLDTAREKQEPGFLQLISEKRAMNIYERMCCKLADKLKDDPSRLLAIEWVIAGRGARMLAIRNPRTEEERKCNRRVEIILKRSDQPLLPKLGSDEMIEADANHGTALEYYHIALQGTSGSEHCKTSAAAERSAREIAEKIPSFLSKRRQEKMRMNLWCLERKLVPSPGFGKDKKNVVVCNDLEFIHDRFKDALQGTASKYSDPDVVIEKAMEIAEATILGLTQMKRKFTWEHATLPQPMDDDCEAGAGVSGGLASHVTCRTHNHILDVSNHTVIAHDLEEYKRTRGKATGR
jgi:outer membrane protein OmpA-like peptidoglycan-associated protein